MTPTNEAGHGLPERALAAWTGKHRTDAENRAFLAGYETCQSDMNATLVLSRGVPAERIAPVQGYTPGIPWSMHLEAYDVYCKRYGKQPALIDLEGRNCRGGFGTNELDMFIPGWRERLSEFNAMKARIAELEAMLAAAPAAAGAQGEDGCDCMGCGEIYSHGEGWFTCPYCKGTGKEIKEPQPAAADGGVRERARELLARELREDMRPGAAEQAESGELDHDPAMRAISAALSSHRQAGDAVGEVGIEGNFIQYAIDDATGRPQEFAPGTKLYTAPPLSKFRELAERWGRSAECLHANGFDIRGSVRRQCAEELIALVEKGAGS